MTRQVLYKETSNGKKKAEVAAESIKLTAISKSRELTINLTSSLQQKSISTSSAQCCLPSILLMVEYSSQRSRESSVFHSSTQEQNWRVPIYRGLYTEIGVPQRNWRWRNYHTSLFKSLQESCRGYN